MNTSVPRRRFLVQAGCAAGVAVVASPLARFACAAAAKPEWLATCRDAITGPMRQKDIWSALKAVGAEGVEIQVADDLALSSLYHPTTKYSLATPGGVDKLAADAKEAGQKITAFCLSNHFEQRPDFEVERCTRLAGIAQTLGVSTIRIDVVPGALPRPEFLKAAVKTLRRVIAATESTGVLFGVENHSNTTNDPAFLHSLFDGVGSTRLGLTLDTGNFYWFGHPLSKIYELVEVFASRVFHTHCKSIRYPAEEREKQRPMGWKYGDYGCPINEGDVDYARVVAILHKAGYRNDFCVENEFLGKTPGAKAAETLAKEITLLKQLRTNVAG